jgi:diguanylate cyclase (GGDEF)-like protein/PAS domain S-box-containing protein
MYFSLRRQHIQKLRWMVSLFLCFLCWFPLSSSAKAAALPDFRDVFKQQNVVMLVIDPQSGQIIDANPAAIAFYGYTKPELMNMHIQQINQLSKEQVAVERQLAETQGRNYFIFRHKLKSGEVRTVEVHSEPYKINGKSYLLSMINDISSVRTKNKDLWTYQTLLEKMVDKQKLQIAAEKQRQVHYLLVAVVLQMLVIGYLLYDIRRRQQLQKELNTVAGTLGRIMNAATEVAIIATDTKGYITSFNAGAEKLLGYGAEEMVGKQTPHAFHIEDEVKRKRMQIEKEIGSFESDMQVFTYQSEEDGGAQGEWTYLRKDGQPVPVSLVVTPIYADDNKTIIGYLGIARDISKLKESQHALLQAQNQLRATLDAIPDMLFEVNNEGHMINYHTAVTNKLYMPPSDFLGKRYQDVLPPNVVEVCDAAFDEAREKGRSSGRQYEMFTPSGKRYFELSVSCKRNEKREYSFVVLARDITERFNAQQHLRLIGNVFNHAREGITITDIDGNIIDVNKGFTDITGYQREEVLGKNPRMLKSNLQSADFYKDMWKDISEKGYWTGEMWNRHKSGEVYAEVITVSAIYDDKGQVQNYMGIFTDVTSIKENQKRLEHIAHYDVLTQLPNRVLLADRLQQAIIHADRNDNSLAVLFVDLDGFKEVNDLYGHDVGDQLLVKVSERMQASLRAEDTLARLGGDEFVAVLVDLESPQSCEPVLERMLMSISEPILIGEHLVKVSASIGVALYPNDLSDADLLIRHADQAMYQAKQEGKNRFRFFDVDQDAIVKSQTALLSEIRNAILENQFVLYYQPKADLETAEVCGAEALIRWEHPVRGLLYPDEFLPVIHDHPLSVDLDEWVMKTAIEQWDSWHQQGLNIPISINISARSLLQKDFKDRIQHCLSRFPAINSSALSFEVLETTALEDVHHVGDLMRFCHKLGLEFALDDFGTGYSSLTYLRHLPARMIKIDQSFVRDMLEDSDDMAIVDGILKLTQAFGRDVIAEGVETLEHCQKLYAMGCPKVQGYVIARPIKSDDFPNWVKVVSRSAIQHLSEVVKDPSPSDKP